MKDVINIISFRFSFLFYSYLIQPPAAFSGRKSTASSSSSSTSALLSKNPPKYTPPSSNMANNVLYGSPDNRNYALYDRMIDNGYPGYQFAIVDPSNQYQRYLIVVLQCLSGTDPTCPPRYNPTLNDDGSCLSISVPVDPVLFNTRLMTDARVSWMREGSSRSTMQSYQNTYLAGMGPAIASVRGANNSGKEQITTEWNIPLDERCDEVIGSYSINNFPAKKNKHGKTFNPVVMEFKLSTIEQSVKKEATVTQGLWLSDDEEGGNDSGTENTYVDPNFAQAYSHNSSNSASYSSPPSKRHRHH